MYNWRPTNADFRPFPFQCHHGGHAGFPVHVHCIGNYRVSAFFYRYPRDVLGVDETQGPPNMEHV